MAWDKEHKQHTRQRILDSAARLFTQRGFDAVGINDVMQAAGLTRGAFYAHFDSKSELYAEAIITAGHLAHGRLTVAASSSQQADLSVADVVARYLSQEHSSGEGDSCPLAFLTTDINQRDDGVREAYTRVFTGFVGKLGNDDSGKKSDAALQSAVLMIGGLAIARALNDDRLSEQVLLACRQGVDKVLESG